MMKSIRSSFTGTSRLAVATVTRGLGRGVVLGVLLLGLALPVAADAAEPEGWAYDVWHDLMSPFCPGRSLADCPSPQAESLRAWILVQEATGRSRTDVEAELLERYGDVILAAPRAEGIGLAAYAIPALAFLAGGVLVGVILRRYTRTGPAAPRPSAEALDPELARLVDEDLERGDARAGPSG
jgi:cytochrome c-type biogenesis protein CcmH/NrfF